MDGRSDGRLPAYGIVLVATGSYACLMFIWFSLPAYLPVIIEEIGLTGTQAGVLAGAVPLTYIPLALVTGLVVDRLGPGRTVAAGVTLYGIGQIGRSVAPDFPSLLAFTLLIGVGATTITFGLPKLVSILFPPDRTGFPSSIYLIGASAGTATAFAIGRPTLGPMLGGWRPLFFWSGVVAIGYAVVWAIVSHRARIDHQSAKEGDATFSFDSIRRDLGLILTHRELRLIVVIGTMYLLMSHGMQGWLPTVLESRGLAPTRAGQITSLLVVAYAVGVLTVPPIADRLAVRRIALVVCGGVAFFGVAGVLVGGAGYLMLGSVVLAGIGVGGLSPLIRAIPPELEGIGARLTGTAMGFIFAVGEIGGFLGPVLVGTFYDVTGSFAPGLGLLATAGIVVALSGNALRRHEASDVT